MSSIISISIDLAKIDKSKIIQGKKGKYYNLQVFVNDEKDKYGNDVAVSNNQTKEERERKEKKVYLGNGRVVWTGASNNSNKPNAAMEAEPENNANNDLPW